MIDPAQIDYGAVVTAAQQGSPFVLSAVGRVFGLGDEERQALARGSVGTWILCAGVLGLGLVAGVQIQKRWPRKVPSWLGGGR